MTGLYSLQQNEEFFMKRCLLTATIVLWSTGAMAQHAPASANPIESGQAQFAAIAEIVTYLRSDPKTDWSKVDIKALRDHLVDMDSVTTKAEVALTIDGMTVTFAITGDDPTAASIQRMVLAHSPMLQQSTGWSVTAYELPGGATMVVKATSQDILNQVTGLGFFGLMTVGAHHQQHHLMIAMGHSPH